MKASNLSKTQQSKSFGASPVVAATYAAGIAYMWGEAAIRFLATNTALGGWYFLYPMRTGDVAAIWLTGIIASLVVFVVAYALFKGKTRVGSLWVWTAILVISTIIAPLIGEIGTPIGI